MPKIPRGLTDKDMVKNYIEEETIEQQLLTAAKKAEKLRMVAETEAPPAPLAKAGFTPELSNAGVKSYNFKIKRDGEKITLTATDKKLY